MKLARNFTGGAGQPKTKMRAGVAIGWLVVLGVGLYELGGLMLVLSVAGLVSIIGGHELGHFLMAKRAGMAVTDFFIGFGPVLWSAQIKETRYGVRMFLVGGYVKVPGMNWQQDVLDELEPATYRRASTHKKVLFAGAGPAANIVMAVLLLWVTVTVIGVGSTSHIGVAKTLIWSGVESPAAKAGLRAGDRIVKVDGVYINSANKLVSIIESHAGSELRIVVERGDVWKSIRVFDTDARKIKVAGKYLASGSRPVGMIGVELEYLRARSTVLGGLGVAVLQVGRLIGDSSVGIVRVFSPSEFVSLAHQIFSNGPSPRGAASRPMSMVGVIRVAVQGGDKGGVGVVLTILAGINVFVGLFNLIPLAPLDGGYIAGTIYERARSRKGREHRANPKWVGAGVYLFGIIMVAMLAGTLYLDIAHPIANPF